MAIDLASTATGVITAAIVGAGGGIWIRMTESGRAFWTSLGTVEMPAIGPLDPSKSQLLRATGSRLVAVTAVVAGAISIAALLTDLLWPEPTLKVVSELIKNTDGQPNFHQTNGFVQITNTSDNQICTISSESVAAGGGDCSIRINNGRWEGKADIGPTC